MHGDSGGAPAFEEAFDEVFNLAFGVAGRILTDRHEAQDVAAETAARALVHWRKVAGLPHRSAWVARVATNLAIDAVRRRRPTTQLGDQPDRDIGDLDAADMAGLLAPLPRRQREVLALRYVVDLADEDIAVALGISTGSVKKHAARGLAALRGSVAAPMREVTVAY